MSKVNVLIAVAALSLAIGCGRRQAEPPHPNVLLSSEQGVAAAAVEQSKALLERYYRVSVRVDPVTDTCCPARTSIKKLRSASDKFTVGLLVDNGGSVTNAVTVEGDIAFVDTGALQDDAGAGPAATRIAGETMRALGLLIGLEDCPNTRCCMHRAASARDLDGRGVNQCPPCHTKSMDILREAGLLTVESPPAPRPHTQ